jgi:hypothetical protein
LVLKMSPLAFSTTSRPDPAKPVPGHREYIAVTQYFRCYYCHRLMDMDGHTESQRQHGYSFTVEHVLPRSRGGTNELSNKVASCYRCNTLRNYIEARLQGHGQWEDIDIPAELFIKLLPVDMDRWAIYNPLMLDSVIERMRWGRETL